MKKLLGIVVLGLLWCNVGFAQIVELYKCYPIKGKRTFESFEDYQKDGTLEDVIYSINAETGKITRLIIYSDDYLEKDLEKQRIVYKRDKEEFKKKYHKNRPSLGQKYYKDYYRVLDFVGPVMTAIEGMNEDERSPGIKFFLNINFEKQTVNWIIKDLPFGGDLGVVKRSKTYQCNSPTTDTAKDPGETKSGTAFFINSRGHLLTNNHVVEGCTLSKISYKNNDYESKLIATDKTLDLALLKAEIRPKIFFNFSKDEPKKLSKVYVAGYPLGKGLSDDLKISSGIVSSLKGFEDNSNEIQIDAPINPGNSGGPIINENGDLVAIAVSGLAKDLTEGINFGIKASAAENFLKSNKINPKKSMYSGIKDNDKLLKILEEGTVYTFCE